MKMEGRAVDIDLLLNELTNENVSGWTRSSQV